MTMSMSMTDTVAGSDDDDCRRPPITTQNTPTITARSRVKTRTKNRIRTKARTTVLTTMIW